MTPEELAARLRHAAEHLDTAMLGAVTHAGALGKALIQANASGRPGPNVITGAYRSSWRTEPIRIPYGAMCTIGTDAPQGRRLEFGFTGVDSLGRYYDQPPFPHVGPALPAIGEALQQSVREAMEAVFE
ncbi:hypothetical protein [Streptomyces sp. 8L]|uniref:hypothetical protein n=1 Tax=Streptomyces sp. 8L TaxID=2877242 RepID=UPI001CD58E95|nr:hypothetical protein [Streptomyces sp. 8L]MCA1220252.1 hypothetical protein [Streptomyces sp. 8L]